MGADHFLLARDPQALVARVSTIRPTLPPGF
jgi:hypothetical protein